MFSLLGKAAPSQRTALAFVCASFFVYFVMMDMTQYFTLQTQKLLEDTNTASGYSPFSPMSIKLLLTNYVEHYLTTPTVEYFDRITKFSKIFYFITPNMITLSHFLLALVATRMAYSDFLYYRRVAVVLFYIRSWLDALDGVVYRSHKGEHIYTSNKNEWGYLVDALADTAGGVFFCTGMWWHLTKTVKPKQAPLDQSWKISLEEGGEPSIATEKHPIVVKYSKKYLYLMIWKYGLLIFISAGAWTYATEKYQEVYEVALADQEKQVLQLASLRSNTTWFIFWLWRMLEGQLLLHVICIVHFCDKLWDFLNFIPVYGYAAFIFLNGLTHLHIYQVRSSLGL
ncbi:hypothetical protein ScPMuIL_010854 [Solemya velum]